MAWGYMRAQGGQGGSSNIQPIGNIQAFNLYVDGDRSYGKAKADSFGADFEVSGNTLVCKQARTYRVQVTAFFRYSKFYVRKNGDTILTVDGERIGNGGSASGETTVDLASGDVLSCTTSYQAANTRFAVGDALIFRA